MTFEGELQLRSRVAELEAQLAGAQQELAVERTALAAAMKTADELQAELETARADIRVVMNAGIDKARELADEHAAERDHLQEQLTLAQGEAEMAENDLTTAQSQLKVMGTALRGAEQGREAAVAVGVVMREQLESWAKGGRPLEATQHALTATAELAEAFVQSVRDRWEKQIVEALRGGGDPDALVSKEFADAWSEVVDRVRVTIAAELAVLVEHVFTVRRRFASGAADAAEVSTATQLVFDAIAALGAAPP